MNEKPTELERHCAAVVYEVLKGAPNASEACDFLAQVLAAHRARTRELVLEEKVDIP